MVGTVGQWVVRGRMVRVVRVRTTSRLHGCDLCDIGGNGGGSWDCDGDFLDFGFGNGFLGITLLLGKSKTREGQNRCE